MSAGIPWMCTGMIALVRSVMAASIFEGSMQYVRGSISTNTGIAFWWRAHEADARNVNAEVITSSPGPTPTAARAMCRAAVPLHVVRQCFDPT